MEPDKNDAEIETEPSATARSGAFGITLDLICLSLWLGGLIIIGAIVAPVAFHVVQTLPWLYLSPSEQKTLAGAIIGGSLRIFNYLTYVLGFILIVRMLILWRRPWCVARLLLILVILGISLALGFIYFPAMDNAQAAGAMTRFDTLHHQYEMIAQIQMLLLVLFSFAYAHSTQEK